MPEINLFYDQNPIKIIGQDTGQVYAEGTEANCFRKLQSTYDNAPGNRKDSRVGNIYLEPLQVIRLKK